MAHPAFPIAAAAVGIAASVGTAVPLWLVAFAQDVPGVGSSGEIPTSVLTLLATAVSSEAALLGWMLRRFLSGEWVRVEQDEQRQMLKKLGDALADAKRREDDYLAVLRSYRESARDREIGS